MHKFGTYIKSLLISLAAVSLIAVGISYAGPTYGGAGLSYSGSGGGGSGGTPASPTTSVQFNNAGAFGGSANLTWNGSGLGITTSSGQSINITSTANTFPILVTNNSASFGLALSNSSTSGQEFHIANNTQAIFELEADGTGRWASNGVFGFTSGAATSALDTALSRIAPDVVAVGNGTAGDATGALESRSFVATGATPTLTGTCTTNTQTGANTAGTFKATCTAQTVIITFAFTAPTGWTCNAHDFTTPTDALNQTASSTTSCTLTGTTAAADVVSFNATAY